MPRRGPARWGGRLAFEPPPIVDRIAARGPRRYPCVQGGDPRSRSALVSRVAAGQPLGPGVPVAPGLGRQRDVSQQGGRRRPGAGDALRSKTDPAMANRGAELKSITGPFGLLLRDIVTTIDEHGLR